MRKSNENTKMQRESTKVTNPHDDIASTTTSRAEANMDELE